ncbi:MAG: hypothetical protein JWN70_3572 [Planctomycetaceae bacterium]|nr:hypothetical protein [Planctomycetaceae bacterium]
MANHFVASTIFNRSTIYHGTTSRLYPGADAVGLTWLGVLRRDFFDPFDFFELFDFFEHIERLKSQVSPVPRGLGWNGDWLCCTRDVQ